MSFDSSMRANAWKWLALLAITVFSICVLLPKDSIRLGLDLRGGTSFTLGVDEEALRESVMAQVENTNDVSAIDARIKDTMAGCDERIVEVVRRRVDGMGMNEPVIQGMKGHRLLVQLPGSNDVTRAEAKRSLQSASYLEFRLTHPRNRELVNKLLASNKAPEGYRLSEKGDGFARAENYDAIAKKPGYKVRLSSFGRPPQGA